MLILPDKATATSGTLPPGWESLQQCSLCRLWEVFADGRAGPSVLARHSTILEAEGRGQL